MWFDKQDSRALFVDRRDEEHEKPRKCRVNVLRIEIKPDVMADFTQLPFPDESFWHVVMDPPHYTERAAGKGNILKHYGCLFPGWQEMLSEGFRECFRVLKPGGTFIFKWCEHEIPLREILALTPEKPLYGHRTGSRQKTHWVAFLKSHDFARKLEEERDMARREAEAYRNRWIGDYTIEQTATKLPWEKSPANAALASESQRIAAGTADEKPDGQAENR